MMMDVRAPWLGLPQPQGAQTKLRIQALGQLPVSRPSGYIHILPSIIVQAAGNVEKSGSAPPDPGKPSKQGLTRSSARTRRPLQQKPSDHVSKPAEAPMPPMLDHLLELLSVSVPHTAGAALTGPLLQPSSAAEAFPDSVPASTAATSAPAPTEAALRAALRSLSAFSPDTYQTLLRAAASLMRPAYPPLPPPYASLAGFRKLKQDSTQPDSNTSTPPTSLGSPAHVADLAQQLSTLLGTDQDTLLSYTFPEHYSSSQGSNRQPRGSPGGSVAAGTSRVSSVIARANSIRQQQLHGSPSELLSDDEGQVAKEMVAAAEQDGGPPEGSIERVLWMQAAEQGKTISLKPVLMTVPGWVDKPYVTPAVPSHIPRELYIKGRRLQPPTLRLPVFSRSPSRDAREGRRPTCVARVYWVLTHQDLSMLPGITAAARPLINQLLGWSGQEPLDGCGPLLTIPAHDSNLGQPLERSPSPSADAEGLEAHTGQQVVNSAGSASVNSSGDSSVTSRVGSGAGKAGQESELPAAVRAAVHATRLTLHNLYVDAVEIHVYAADDVLNQYIGTAAVRKGVTSLDLLGHVLTHQSRAHRLMRRRRRDWRLLARAKAWRASGYAQGAPQPARSLSRAAAEHQDDIDAWADHFAFDPDYPPVLVTVPEKDLIQAATTGKLPPRYKRFMPAGSRQHDRSSVARGQQVDAGQARDAQDFESQVLDALNDLKERLTMPWVSSPGRCELQAVTLRQLLASLGVVVHSCGAGEAAGSGSAQTAGRDMQALHRLTTRHYPSTWEQQQQAGIWKGGPPVNLLMAVLGSDPQLVQALPASEDKQMVSRLVVSDNPDCLMQAQAVRADVCMSWQGLMSGSYLPGSGSAPLG